MTYFHVLSRAAIRPSNKMKTMFGYFRWSFQQLLVHISIMWGCQWQEVFIPSVRCGLHRYIYISMNCCVLIAPDQTAIPRWFMCSVLPHAVKFWMCCLSICFIPYRLIPIISLTLRMFRWAILSCQDMSAPLIVAEVFVARTDCFEVMQVMLFTFQPLRGGIIVALNKPLSLLFSVLP